MTKEEQKFRTLDGLAPRARNGVQEEAITKKVRVKSRKK